MNESPYMYIYCVYYKGDGIVFAIISLPSSRTTPLGPTCGIEECVYTCTVCVYSVGRTMNIISRLQSVGYTCQSFDLPYLLHKILLTHSLIVIHVNVLVL